MVNLDIKFWGEKMKKIQFLVIAAILSFGLIISSAILSNMVEKVNKREDSISVKGVAERKVKANKGVLILTLMRSNKTAEDAYSKLEEDLTTIKDEITILDLVENEIEYSNIKTEPIYNGNTKEILSYNVYQTITITTNKVDTLANTSLELSKLTLKLPNLVVDTPEYYLTDNQSGYAPVTQIRHNMQVLPQCQLQRPSSFYLHPFKHLEPESLFIKTY